MGEVGSSEQAVLIVDRDRRYRQDAARALYLAGWDVLQAATGDEAIALAAKAELALAIIDTRLIGMSGSQLAARLRQTHGDALPILLVSDEWPGPTGGVEELVAQADQLLRPSTFDELLASVRRRIAAATPELAPTEPQLAPQP